MIPIVVLASGRGSNFDAILGAIQEKRLEAEILAVISDRPEALVLQKALKVGVKAISVPMGAYASPLERRLEHEKRLLEELSALKPHFLVMAGYMRIMTAHFLDKFRSERGYVRGVNIHPSLLPAFPGTRAYRQAFQYGAKVAGVTVHLVESDVDSGPICAQECFSIEDCGSEEEVEARGLEIEHRLYPEALRWILTENFSFEGRPKGRFYVRPN